MRDVLANVTRNVFPDVETEPQLLPFQNENPHSGGSANRSIDARVDMRVRGFWTRQQKAFCYIRVTHPKTNLSTRTQAIAQLENNERKKSGSTTSASLTLIVASLHHWYSRLLEWPVASARVFYKL